MEIKFTSSPYKTTGQYLYDEAKRSIYFDEDKYLEMVNAGATEDADVYLQKNALYPTITPKDFNQTMYEGLRDDPEMQQWYLDESYFPSDQHEELQSMFQEAYYSMEADRAYEVQSQSKKFWTGVGYVLGEALGSLGAVLADAALGFFNMGYALGTGGEDWAIDILGNEDFSFQTELQKQLAESAKGVSPTGTKYSRDEEGIKEIARNKSLQNFSHVLSSATQMVTAVVAPHVYTAQLIGSVYQSTVTDEGFNDLSLGQQIGLIAMYGGTELATEYLFKGGVGKFGLINLEAVVGKVAGKKFSSELTKRIVVGTTKILVDAASEATEETISEVVQTGLDAVIHGKEWEWATPEQVALAAAGGALGSLIVTGGRVLTQQNVTVGNTTINKFDSWLLSEYNYQDLFTRQTEVSKQAAAANMSIEEFKTTEAYAKAAETDAKYERGQLVPTAILESYIQEMGVDNFPTMVERVQQSYEQRAKTVRNYVSAIENQAHWDKDGVQKAFAEKHPNQTFTPTDTDADLQGIIGNIQLMTGATVIVGDFGAVNDATAPEAMMELKAGDKEYVLISKDAFMNGKPTQILTTVLSQTVLSKSFARVIAEAKPRDLRSWHKTQKIINKLGLAPWERAGLGKKELSALDFAQSALFSDVTIKTMIRVHRGMTKFTVAQLIKNIRNVKKLLQHESKYDTASKVIQDMYSALRKYAVGMMDEVQDYDPDFDISAYDGLDPIEYAEEALKQYTRIPYDKSLWDVINADIEKWIEDNGLQDRREELAETISDMWCDVTYDKENKVYKPVVTVDWKGNEQLAVRMDAVGQKVTDVVNNGLESMVTEKTKTIAEPDGQRALTFTVSDFVNPTLTDVPGRNISGVKIRVVSNSDTKRIRATTIRIKPNSKVAKRVVSMRNAGIPDLAIFAYLHARNLGITDGVDQYHEQTALINEIYDHTVNGEDYLSIAVYTPTQLNYGISSQLTPVIYHEIRHVIQSVFNSETGVTLQSVKNALTQYASGNAQHYEKIRTFLSNFMDHQDELIRLDPTLKPRNELQLALILGRDDPTEIIAEASRIIYELNYGEVDARTVDKSGVSKNVAFWTKGQRESSYVISPNETLLSLSDMFADGIEFSFANTNISAQYVDTSEMGMNAMVDKMFTDPEVYKAFQLIQNILDPQSRMNVQTLANLLCLPDVGIALFNADYRAYNKVVDILDKYGMSQLFSNFSMRKVLADYDIRTAYSDPVLIEMLELDRRPDLSKALTETTVTGRRIRKLVGLTFDDIFGGASFVKGTLSLPSSILQFNEVYTKRSMITRELENAMINGFSTRQIGDIDQFTPEYRAKVKEFLSDESIQRDGFPRVDKSAYDESNWTFTMDAYLRKKYGMEFDTASQEFVVVYPFTVTKEMSAENLDVMTNAMSTTEARVTTIGKLIKFNKPMSGILTSLEASAENLPVIFVRNTVGDGDVTVDITTKNGKKSTVTVIPDSTYYHNEANNEYIVINLGTWTNPIRRYNAIVHEIGHFFDPDKWAISVDPNVLSSVLAKRGMNDAEIEALTESIRATLPESLRDIAELTPGALTYRDVADLVYFTSTSEARTRAPFNILSTSHNAGDSWIEFTNNTIKPHGRWAKNDMKWFIELLKTDAQSSAGSVDKRYTQLTKDQKEHNVSYQIYYGLNFAYSDEASLSQYGFSDTFISIYQTGHMTNADVKSMLCANTIGNLDAITFVTSILYPGEQVSDALDGSITSNLEKLPVLLPILELIDPDPKRIFKSEAEIWDEFGIAMEKNPNLMTRYDELTTRVIAGSNATSANNWLLSRTDPILTADTAKAFVKQATLGFTADIKTEVDEIVDDSGHSISKADIAAAKTGEGMAKSAEEAFLDSEEPRGEVEDILPENVATMSAGDFLETVKKGIETMTEKQRIHYWDVLEQSGAKADFEEIFGENANDVRKQAQAIIQPTDPNYTESTVHQHILSRIRNQKKKADRNGIDTSSLPQVKTDFNLYTDTDTLMSIEQQYKNFVSSEIKKKEVEKVRAELKVKSETRAMKPRKKKTINRDGNAVSRELNKTFYDAADYTDLTGVGVNETIAKKFIDGTLTNKDVIAQINKYNGTNPEVVGTTEVWEMMLKTIYPDSSIKTLSDLEYAYSNIAQLAGSDITDPDRVTEQMDNDEIPDVHKEHNWPEFYQAIQDMLLTSKTAVQRIIWQYKSPLSIADARAIVMDIAKSEHNEGVQNSLKLAAEMQKVSKTEAKEVLAEVNNKRVIEGKPEVDPKEMKTVTSEAVAEVEKTIDERKSTEVSEDIELDVKAPSKAKTRRLPRVSRMSTSTKARYAELKNWKPASRRNVQGEFKATYGDQILEWSNQDCVEFISYYRNQKASLTVRQEEALQLTFQTMLRNRHMSEATKAMVQKTLDEITTRGGTALAHKSHMDRADADVDRLRESAKKYHITLDEALLDEYMDAVRNENWFKMSELQQRILADAASKIPSTRELLKKRMYHEALNVVVTKLNAFRYTSMLTNPSTHMRNFTSNVAIGGVNAITERLAAYLAPKINERIGIDAAKGDWVLSAKRLPISKIREDVQAYIDKNFISNGRIDYLLKGSKYNPRTGDLIEDIQSEYPFTGDDVVDKALQKIYKFTFAALGAGDTVFIKREIVIRLGQYLTSRYSQEEFASATKEQIGAFWNLAVADAMQLYLRKENNVSKWYSKVVARFPQLRLVFSAFMPFPKVTANITMFLLRHSPFGLINVISDIVSFKYQTEIITIEEVEQYVDPIPGMRVEKVKKKMYTNPKTGEPFIDPKTGEPIEKTVTVEEEVPYDIVRERVVTKQVMRGGDAKKAQLTGNQRYDIVPQFANIISRDISQSAVGTTLYVLGAVAGACGLLDWDEDAYGALVVRVGDVRLTVDALAPGISALMLGASLTSETKLDNSRFDTMWDVFSNLTIMSTFDNVLTYNDNVPEVIGSAWGSYMLQYVPAIFKSIAKIIDPAKKQTGSKWYLRFAAALPFVSLAVPNKINPYTGDPVNAGASYRLTAFLGMVFPTKVLLDSSDPFEIEAMRLGTETKGPGDRFMINGKEIVLTGNEKLEFEKVRGSFVKSLGLTLMDDDEFLDAKDKLEEGDEDGTPNRTSMVKSLYRTASKYAIIDYWIKQGGTYTTSSRNEYEELKAVFGSSIKYSRRTPKTKYTS